MSDYKETLKLGGARRKNGHKLNCVCHICENMRAKAKRGGYTEDEEKNLIKSMGGSKKKNGHKPNCNCPICKNMRKKYKKGGEGEEENKILSADHSDMPVELDAQDDDYDNLETIVPSTGGTRRRKKSNKKKTRRNKKRSRRHR